MEESTNREEQYNEARAMHQSLDEKLQILQEKPFLTTAEEQEMKVLKKRKLYYKDLMESLKAK
jgi:hypothetical protein